MGRGGRITNLGWWLGDKLQGRRLIPGAAWCVFGSPRLVGAGAHPASWETAFPKAKWVTSCSFASAYVFTAYCLQTCSGGWYGDWLWAGRTGVPTPVGAIRPERPRGPLSLLHNGCRASYLGVKRSGRDVHHPSPSNAEVKEEYSCIPLLLLWIFLACGKVNFAFLYKHVFNSQVIEWVQYQCDRSCILSSAIFKVKIVTKFETVDLCSKYNKYNKIQFYVT